MAPASSPIELAALEPAGLPRAEPAPPVGRGGPFGLAGADGGALSARWRGLQPTLELEAQMLARCRANPAICPAAAATFNAVIEEARSRSGRARLGAVNRAVNLAIRWTSDLAQYGVTDIWASPLMTFASGAGDCEDYAIAKFYSLRALGMDNTNLRIVVLQDMNLQIPHAILVAYLDGKYMVLDNQIPQVVDASIIHHYRPFYSINEEYWWLHRPE